MQNAGLRCCKEMGAFRKRVSDAMDRVERFLEESARCGADFRASEVSLLILKGDLIKETLEDLLREAEELAEKQEDPVTKSLCLQLQGVLTAEEKGLIKVLEALKTADKAGRLDAEAALHRELKRIREKLWVKENEN